MKTPISFTLNGNPTTLTVDPSRKLLWVLRTDLKLTGTKYGCGEAYCGACTVHVGGAARRSCAITIGEVQGEQVTTIEGLAKGTTLHPVQAAFADHDALQCGYCTPGMIMSAAAFLTNNPKASRPEILAGLEDNLCRCAAHKRIAEALEELSQR